MRFKTDQSKEKTKKDEASEAVVNVIDQLTTETVRKEDDSPVVKEIPALTHLAVGVYHNVQTNQFHVVKVSYNPLTLDAGNVIIGQGTSRVESEYEFKTIAGGEIF